MKQVFIPYGPIKFINVDVVAFRSNFDHKTSLPVWRVEIAGQASVCGLTGLIHGESSLHYEPTSPRPYGATIWIQTIAALTIIGVQEES